MLSTAYKPSNHHKQLGMEPTRAMILLSVLLVFAATEIAAQLDEDSAFLTVVPDDLETHVQSRTVRLTCVAYGVPFPNVTWIRLPSTVLTANTTNTTAVNGTMEGGLVTSTLKLCDVQQTHNGMYRCETSNGVTSETPENSITAKNFSLVIIPIESPSLVLYSPDRVYGEANTTIRVVCSATGVPNPTINWTIPNHIGKVYLNTTTMNGTEIVTSVLELCSVNISDTGMYSCIAANERGNESKSFDVTVTMSPVLDQPASNEPVEVLRGNDVTLNCRGESFPLATITWLRNGVTLTDPSKYTIINDNSSSGGIFSFTSMITIASLVKVDEANYSCRAQVEGSNMTSEIEYRVIVIIPVTPTIILRPPSNVTLGAAQTVRLTCSGTGVPTPNVTWFNSTDDQLTNYTDVRVFNNEEIINGTTIVTSVLQLCSIKIADAGVYRCQTGNDSTTVDVLVQVQVNVTNGVLQRTKEMEEFKNITLECNVSGHPLPMVTWLRDNMTLNTNMKYLISNRTFEAMGSQTPGLMEVMSRLTIVNLGLDDSDNYICHAENTNSSQEVLYQLTVTSPARIIDSSPNSLTRTAKSDVTLQCTGAGVPIPTVKWSNSAGPISTDSYHTVTQTPEMNHATMSTLRFPMLRISQAGTYECTAGSSSVEFTVQVQVPAKVESTGRVRVDGKVNESATLTCTADGHPLPTISWFKNGTELRNIRKYFPSNDDASEGFRSDEQQYPGIMQVTSRLIIQDLQSADSGTYTCQAQSSGTPANSSDPYQLLVSEPPPPDPCDIKNCNHGNCEKKKDGTPECVCTGGYTGDDCDNPPPMTPVGIAPEIVTHPTSVRVRLFSRANLTCRAIGNPAPDIYWYKNDNAMPEWKNREQITFNQVTLGDRGFYHCLVNNSEGRETSSDALLNIRDIVQYRVDVNLPTLSARRRRQANTNSMLLQDLIAQINMLMVGVEFEGARFFSAVKSMDSNAIIMTFTSANVNTGRLKTFVDERLAAANLTVNTTGNQTVTITTTTAFSRFDGCPSERTVIPPISASSSLNISIDWPESNIGQNVTVDCPCGNLSLGSTSLVAHRYCNGSFLTGGVWGKKMDSRCNASDISRTICELSNEPPAERLDGLNDIFTNNTADMIMDFEVTASVSLLVDTTSQAKGNQTLSMSYLKVVDNLVKLEPTLLAQTQESANTSSRLLEGIMNLAENLPIPENTTEPVVVTETNFVVSVQRVDPSTIAPEGLSFGAGFGNNFNFTPDGEINRSLLMFNQTATTPVTASVLLPLSILNTTNNTRVAFSVFLTDILFLRRMKESQNQDLGSVIVSATVVGHTFRNITPRVKLVFQKNNNVENGTAPDCNFWNQTLDEGYGDWSGYGCERVNYNESDPNATNVTCLCNHLTSFAILLDVSYVPHNGTIVDKVSDNLTYIGVSVSIVCLLITMATYISIKKLRTKDQGQLLLLLCFALLGLYVSFILAGIPQLIRVDELCVVLSTLIQYFMLVTFMSMLAESVNLYMKLVVVLGSQINYYVIKAYIVVWLIPIFVVLLTLIPGIRDYHNDHFCIPRQIPFYIGTIVPVLVIYLFNCVLFVIIFASLIKKSRQSKSKKSDESGGNGNYQLVKQQFIAALSLAVLFGLGWGFGFIATSALNSVEPTLRHIMQILFILFTSFQGLFVFLFQCVYSKAVRDVWVAWFTRVVLKKEKHRPSKYISTNSSRAKKSDTLLSNRQGSNSTNSYVEMDSKEKSGSPEILKSPDSFQETACN